MTVVMTAAWRERSWAAKMVFPMVELTGQRWAVMLVSQMAGRRVARRGSSMAAEKAGWSATNSAGSKELRLADNWAQSSAVTMEHWKVASKERLLAD